MKAKKSNARLSIRERFVLWMLEQVAPIHYYLCPNRKPWNLSSFDLLKFPDGSLGKELGLFYKTHKFEPFPKGERHDVFHVLFNYTTNVADEAYLQFFLWGNGKVSLFTIGTCIVCIMLFPFQCTRYIEEFKRGKNYKNISGLNFESMLGQNMAVLRQNILKTI